MLPFTTRAITFAISFTNNSKCDSVLVNGTFVIGDIGSKRSDRDRPVGVIEWGNVQIPARGTVDGKRHIDGLGDIETGKMLYADYIISATSCE